MRRVTIAVMGNAKTTRANLEALISDVVDSVDEAELVVIYDQTPSEGVVWATQYAQDKEIYKAQYTDNAYDNLIAESDVRDLRFFMLWDDDDPECQLASSVAQEHNVPAYDLTDGLIMISLNKGPISRPTVPAPPIIESVVNPTVEPEPEPAPEPEPDDDEETDELFFEIESDLGELLSLAIQEAGRIFAKSFAEEFIRILKK